MQYLIPAILAVVSGLILWTIKRERFSLTYEIVKSEVFPRDRTPGMYFVCTLRNSGNRPIENISYKFIVSDGTIESVEFSDSKLIQLSTENDYTLEGSIALLNPKEDLGAIVTIIGASERSTASLEARAVGATARKATNRSTLQVSTLEVVNIFLLVVTLGFVAGFSMWTFYGQSKVGRTSEGIGDINSVGQEAVRREKEFGQGNPEREHKVFAILNKSGLGFILPSLLASGDELPYWKTGLHIMHNYLTDKTNAPKYVDALDQLSRTEEIAPASRGFLLYLAGKIEQDQGNSKRAIEFLEKCKKETPLMYDHLMAQDPAYDLRAVEKAVSGKVASRPTKPTQKK